MANEYVKLIKTSIFFFLFQKIKEFWVAVSTTYLISY